MIPLQPRLAPGEVLRVLLADDPRFALVAGDVLVCRAYPYDLTKLIAVRRLADGFDPSCTVYRSQTRPVPRTERVPLYRCEACRFGAHTECRDVDCECGVQRVHPAPGCDRASDYDEAYQAITGSTDLWGGCHEREAVDRVVALIQRARSEGPAEDPPPPGADTGELVRGPSQGSGANREPGGEPSPRPGVGDNRQGGRGA